MRPPRARPDPGVRGAAGIRIGGSGGGRHSPRRSPQTSGMARPRDPSLHPSSAGAAEFGGVWEPPPTLYPNSGAGGNPSPHFSENFLSWGPPRSLSHSYPKSPRIECAPGPLKLLSSNSLNWGSWEPLLLPPQILKLGAPRDLSLSLPLNFLKPSQTLALSSQNWGLLRTPLFYAPNL